MENGNAKVTVSIFLCLVFVIGVVMLVFEFCAENLTYIDKAIAAGAGRIELCDNLAVGGTTPEYRCGQ